MSTIKQEMQKLNNGEWDETLIAFYGKDILEESQKRYAYAFERFAKTYGWDRKVRIFSIPTQILIGDNNQAVFSVATTKDMLAIVAENGTNIFRFQSVGFFGEENIDLYQPGPYAEEVGTMSALLRGMLTAFRNNKYDVYGVDIYVDTALLPGEGIFFHETVLATLATIFNAVFNEEEISSASFVKLIQWVADNYFHQPLQVMGSFSSFEGGVLAGYKTDDGEYAYAKLSNLLMMDAFCAFEVMGEINANEFIELQKTSLHVQNELLDLLSKSGIEIPNNAVSQNNDTSAPMPLVEKAVGGASIWRMKQNKFTNTACVFSKKDNADDVISALTNLFGATNVKKLKISHKKASELTKMTEKKPQQEIPYEYYEGE